MRADKKAAAEVVYWTPANKVESSSISTPEIEPVYFLPPQTPQDAIDRGFIGTESPQPKDWVPFHKRLTGGSKPEIWHCMWGCEGSCLSVMDKNWPGATHDYYCIYWEMLALFPEWIEDFELKPWHRPARPKGKQSNPPYDEWNTSNDGANYERRNKETGEHNARSINSGVRKNAKRNAGVKRIKTTKSKPISKGNGSNESGFTISEPKQRQSRNSNNRN